MNTLFKRNKLALVLFMLPVLLIFSGIIIIPLIQGFLVSFTKWDGVNAPVFAGLSNYKRLFTSSDLKLSMRNSIIYSIILTIYQLGLGTLIAFVLTNLKIKGQRIVKDCIFFPVILSITVVAQLWVSIYHGDFGLINQVSKALGSAWTQTWLSEPVKGIVALTIAEAWKGMGYHMLIIYAAMKNVPSSYYEAARIDGANERQQFWGITVPLISQTLKVCFVMCITYGFRAFDMIFIVTKGGPGNYSSTLSIMMYKAIFGLQKYGYSNAIGMFIVFLCVGIMIVIEKIFEKTQVEY